MVKAKLSAGVIVVHRAEQQWRFLLLRAFQYWDFPKGMVESAEEPFKAAVREVEEETTLTGLQFNWGYDFIETAPYNHGKKIARYYLAESPATEITLPVNPLLGRPEHNAYLWASHDQARALVTLRVQRVLDWAWTRLQEGDYRGS